MVARHALIDMLVDSAVLGTKLPAQTDSTLYDMHLNRGGPLVTQQLHESRPIASKNLAMYRVGSNSEAWS